MLKNTLLQRLKRGKPTDGLPSGRQVTCPRDLSITLNFNVKTTGQETWRRTMERKRLNEGGGRNVG